MKKFTTVDEYIKSFPKPVSDLLKKIRKAIIETAPGAEEVISYNMPGYKLGKRLLVWFAAGKNHIGFYPTPSPIKKLKDELSEYKTSKGAIQFPIEDGIPVSLVKKIVRMRVEEEIKNYKL